MACANEHCRYAQHCWMDAKGELEPEDCPVYFKIDDLMLDAELSKDDYHYKDEEEPLPFTDPPEEGWEDSGTDC